MRFQASALADLFNTNSGTTYASAVAGSPVKEIADNACGSSLTESGIADAVWNEAQSGHTSPGTFGLYLDAKVSEAGGCSLTAADIADAVWDEASTGHTDAGKAGAQVWTGIDAILVDTGTNIPASLTTIAGYVDTEVASILAAVDTEIASVKAVTDKVDAAMELDGAVYRFTANALEQAPTGSGGKTPVIE